MKVTDNPCMGCERRTAECGLSCVRYKVYHTAKMKEYDERKKAQTEQYNLHDHFRSRKNKIRKREIKFTPTPTSKMKEV